jgi:hypothetical protein
MQKTVNIIVQLDPNTTQETTIKVSKKLADLYQRSADLFGCTEEQMEEYDQVNIACSDLTAFEVKQLFPTANKELLDYIVEEVQDVLIWETA